MHIRNISLYIFIYNFRTLGIRGKHKIIYIHTICLVSMVCRMKGRKRREGERGGFYFLCNLLCARGTEKRDKETNTRNRVVVFSPLHLHSFPSSWIPHAVLR